MNNEKTVSGIYGNIHGQVSGGVFVRLFVCAVLALDSVRNAATSYVEKNDLEKCFIDKFQSAVEKARQKLPLHFFVESRA